MALVRVYCGVAAAETAPWLTVAVVDDAGRLLDMRHISDDPAGYAYLGALLADRSGGSAPVALDRPDHLVAQLLAAANRPLAIPGEASLTGFTQRFADDTSYDEGPAPLSQRRAVGLARALQAGVLYAGAQSPSWNLDGLKPVLTAHAAVAAGRQAAAAALREVLRELYPAALRAYPDPAEYVPLKVLEALPEPSLLNASPSSRSRDAALIAELASSGVCDATTAVSALSALRAAVDESSRWNINRALAPVVAETVKQSVAAVRACDSASAALVAALVERVGALTADPVAPPAPAPTHPRPVAPMSPPVARRPFGPAASVPANRLSPRASTASAAAAGVAATATDVAATDVADVADVAGTDVAASGVTGAAGTDVATAGAAATSATAVGTPAPDPTTPGPYSPQHGVLPAQPEHDQHTQREPPYPDELSYSDPRFPEPPYQPPQSLPDHAHRTATMAPAAASSTEPEYAATGYATAGDTPPGYPTPGVPAPGSRRDWPSAPPSHHDDDIAAVYPAVPATSVPASSPPAIPLPTSPVSMSPVSMSSAPATGGDYPLAFSQDPRHAPLVRTPRHTPPTSVSSPGASADPPSRAMGSGVSSPTVGGDAPPRADASRVGPRHADLPRAGPQHRADTPPAAPVPDQPTDPLTGPLPSTGSWSIDDGSGTAAPDRSPTEDTDLLIFSLTRSQSAWFTMVDEHTPAVQPPSWSGIADEGWRAAEQLAEPAAGGPTTAGLPRRVPQANLVPGSADPPHRRQRILRDARTIAADTSGYFRGWKRGQEVGSHAAGQRARQAWDLNRDERSREGVDQRARLSS